MTKVSKKKQAEPIRAGDAIEYATWLAAKNASDNAEEFAAWLVARDAAIAHPVKVANTTEVFHPTVVRLGEPAVFTATTKFPAIGFNWRKNGQFLEGSPSSHRYVTAPVAPDDNGDTYSVVVYGESGSEESNEVALVVPKEVVPKTQRRKQDGHKATSSAAAKAKAAAQVKKDAADKKAADKKAADKKAADKVAADKKAAADKAAQK